LSDKIPISPFASSASFLKLLLGVTLLLPLISLQVGAHGTHSSLIAKVDARLAEKPKDGGLWFQRAVLEYEHEEFEAAAVDFAKAENFAPGEYAVLWWQGRIFDQLGKLTEAKATLDAFLEKMPDHWGALASRARVKAKLGANAEALDDFRAALRHCPNAEPDLISEVATAMAAKDRSDEAVSVIEEALRRIGPIPSLQLKLLEVEENVGRYDSALARVDSFQKTAARPEPWMQKRACILASAGRLSQSRSAWHALLAHLKSLPAAERESHAMTLISEHAAQALQVLAAPPTTPVTPNPFTRVNR
jgi:tetratricopeptide (TPR) repeat protein